MVSPLKSGDLGIYILESSSTYNDDWITDHSGDPGEADLDTYTEGLEMIHIETVTGVMNKQSANYESETTFLGWTTKGIGDGKKDYFTYGDEKQLIEIQGEVDETHLEYLQRAFKEFNCTRYNTTTYGAKYLVWQTAADTFKNWYDEDGDEKDYCPVIVRGFDWKYQDGFELFPVRLLVEVVWT